MRFVAVIHASALALPVLATPPSYLEIPLPGGCNSMSIRDMNAAGNVAVGTGRTTGSSNLVPVVAYNFAGASASSALLNVPAPYTDGFGEAVTPDGVSVLCELTYNVLGTTHYAVGVYRGGSWAVLPMPDHFVCTPVGLSDDGSTAYGSFKDQTQGGGFASEIPAIWSIQNGTRASLPLPVGPEGQLTSGRVWKANITANGGILLGLGSIGSSGRNYIIRWIVTPFGVDTSIIGLPWSSLAPNGLIASRDCFRFAVTLYGTGGGFGTGFARIASRATFGNEWSTVMPSFESNGITPWCMSADGAVIAGSSLLDHERPIAWRGTSETDLWALAAQAGFSPVAQNGAVATAMSDSATTFAGNLFRSDNTTRGFFFIADVPEGTIPCEADFNHDGFVDGFDYDDFVRAFETGCP